MEDQKLYGFYLMEFNDNFVAFKVDEDGSEINLTISKKFLKESDEPLKAIRRLELIFKKFLKDAQDEE